MAEGSVRNPIDDPTKVCMVVFNSVSHDARVLKEAQAVRELGHEVVIIGIQDANNRRPFDSIDNGVVIRRAAWNSAAAKPVSWLYLAGVGAAVAAGYGVYWALNHVIGSLPPLETLGVPSIGWRAVLAAVIAALTLGVSVKLWRALSKKRRLFRAALKREDDEFLKFEPEVEQYRRARTGRAAAEAKGRERSSLLARSVPRPLMAGLGRALTPASMRRWKTIWAREARVRDILRSERPHIVHAHDVTALAVCADFSEQTGSKLVFDAHEVYDHLAQSEDDLAEINARVMRKYADNVDAFITINESIAGYYRKHYRGLPHATIVKNAAPLAETFQYDGRLHEVAKLHPERKILIYQGGYAPKRGLIPLLLSAEYLDPSWALVFMGWGRLEPELRRTAEAMCTRVANLAERIRFVPKVPHRELPYWTAGASLGAIPYENVGLNHWFCTPNKLWEYPNAGVPILASPFPELRRIIEPNSIGWFLPDPLTPREIGRVVNSLTPEMLRDAKAACATFIQQDNWAVYSDRLRRAYVELT